jgi:hypothetical protein
LRLEVYERHLHDRILSLLRNLRSYRAAPAAGGDAGSGRVIIAQRRDFRSRFDPDSCFRPPRAKVKPILGGPYM